MGYPCTFPLVIVYVPKSVGGLGFRHLDAEQGLQKCLQLIKHLHACTSTGTIYQILLEQYQIQAGIKDHALINTEPLPWCTAPWTKTMWWFLHQIGGQIWLENPWIQHPHRANDKFIIDKLLKQNLNPKKLQALNNVQIALKVTTVAEITLHTREQLIAALLKQPMPPANKQMAQNPNHSTLCWPKAANPTAQQWRLWSKIIWHTFAKTGSLNLQYPLGPWIAHYNTNYEWTWCICTTTYNLYHNSQQGWVAYWPDMLQWTYICDTHQNTPPTAPIPDTPVMPIIQSEYIDIKFPIMNIHTAVEPPITCMPQLIHILTPPPPNSGNSPYGTRSDPMPIYMHYMNE